MSSTRSTPALSTTSTQQSHHLVFTRDAMTDLQGGLPHSLHMTFTSTQSVFLTHRGKIPWRDLVVFRNRDLYSFALSKVSDLVSLSGPLPLPLASLVAPKQEEHTTPKYRC
eukprot:TRINITY_DN67493_c1_g1_i1.p2 TRINITY_DN67493_c1_g1~~TRINITY_DN67493_c1_g1_i1.p2  ORF type:complete len:111 (+),score=0.56 TRINITY_DN67493_c1_g1_i1:466-798(+)